MDTVILQFSLNGTGIHQTGNLINHSSMNWGQIKDPVAHMCLVGAVVASWLLTQEVADSNPSTEMTSILVTEFNEIIENILGMTPLACSYIL